MSKRIALICVLAFALAGCSDDDDCPECPGPPEPPEPTLGNIWPHADGTSWIYDLEYGHYAGLAIDDEEPPLPSMEDLHAALQEPVDTEELSLDLGLYRLRFDGEVTTESGAVGQDLVETFYGEVDLTLRAADDARSVEQRFLRTLARVRPDLRPAIQARLGGEMAGTKDLAAATAPFFLGAYAFAYEDSGYYGYGDLNTEHAWTYLEGDLSVGSEFALQLVSDLTDDVWLYGRIWSIEDREIAGVTWSHALESMYVVDLGVQIVTDDEGNQIGYFRSYMYGTTIFVPDVGPVACHERHVLAPDDILQDPVAGIEEYRCVLAQ